MFQQLRACLLVLGVMAIIISVSVQVLGALGVEDLVSASDCYLPKQFDDSKFDESVLLQVSLQAQAKGPDFFAPPMSPTQFLMISSPSRSKVVWTRLENFQSTEGRAYALVDSGLSKPKGIAFDHVNGYLYIADSGAQKIFRYTVLVDTSGGQPFLSTSGVQLTIMQGHPVESVALSDYGDLLYTAPDTNNINMITNKTMAEIATGRFSASELEIIPQKTVELEQHTQAGLDRAHAVVPDHSSVVIVWHVTFSARTARKDRLSMHHNFSIDIFGRSRPFCFDLKLSQHHSGRSQKFGSRSILQKRFVSIEVALKCQCNFRDLDHEYQVDLTCRAENINGPVKDCVHSLVYPGARLTLPHKTLPLHELRHISKWELSPVSDWEVTAWLRLNIDHPPECVKHLGHQSMSGASHSCQEET